MYQKFMHLTRHGKIYHRPYIQVEDPIFCTVQLCIYIQVQEPILCTVQSDYTQQKEMQKLLNPPKELEELQLLQTGSPKW
jgi:hypothetical protein